jgi:serine/threonine protein kinase
MASLMSALPKFLTFCCIELVWPDDDSISPEAKSLVCGLLNHDPVARFKAEDIRRHPFFTGVDWEHILDHPAPFIPAPSDGTDTSYFEGKEKCAIFTEEVI